MFLFAKSLTWRRAEPLVRSAKYLCVFFVLISFLLVGCKEEVDDPIPPYTNYLLSSLHGTWRTLYDGYIINISGNTLEYDDGGYGVGFKGTILELVPFNSIGTAGIIFIRYTEKPTDYGHSEPVVGDFIGVYYKSLTNTTAEFANPSNVDYTTPAKNSLAEAKTAFTVGTVGDYVSLWSMCVKQ